MFHTTPHEITEEVAKFCRSFSRHDPVFIDVTPSPVAKQQECFSNINAVVAQQGGKRVLGWIIWYHPGVFIEAEHHAVWEDADGTLFDFTAPPSGETRVLFVRDDTATPYPTTGRNSKRKALNKDPDVKTFVDCGMKVGHSRVQAMRGLHVDPNTQKVWRKMSLAEAAIKAKYGDAYPVS